MKTILTYQEESWLGKAQNRVHGVIFRYDPDNDNRTRLKDVPEKNVLARLEGCWHDQIYYTFPESKVRPPSPPPSPTPPSSTFIRSTQH